MAETEDKLTAEEQQKLRNLVDNNFEKLKKALADPDYARKVLGILGTDKK